MGGITSRTMSHQPDVTPGAAFPMPVARTPSGLLLTSMPGDASPRSLCRSHSGSLLGPVALSSLKRKPSASPCSIRNTLRKKAHIKLSIDIPPLWLPPVQEEISPPRFGHEEMCLSEEAVVARAWIRNLKGRGTRVLALDFDLTCVDVNTNGMWRGTADTLASHFRPVMREVILEAHSIGIKVAVASFSGQPQLIQEVLDLAVPDMSDHVLIRAGSSHHVSMQMRGMEESQNRVKFCRNKQKHIQSVLQHLADTEGEMVAMSQVMLIDDDWTNVGDARTNGAAAVWFNPEENLSFVCDLCQCQEMSTFSCSMHNNCTSEGITSGTAMITA